MKHQSSKQGPGVWTGWYFWVLPVTSGNGAFHRLITWTCPAMTFACLWKTQLDGDVVQHSGEICDILNPDFSLHNTTARWISVYSERVKPASVCMDTAIDPSRWGSCVLDPSNPDLSQLPVLYGSTNCTLYSNILHISAMHTSEAPPASQLCVQAQPADHAHNHNPADPTKSKTQPKQTLPKAERNKGTKIYIYINI